VSPSIRSDTTPAGSVRLEKCSFPLLKIGAPTSLCAERELSPAVAGLSTVRCERSLESWNTCRV